jgi:hypothetical protein
MTKRTQFRFAMTISPDRPGRNENPANTGNSQNIQRLSQVKSFTNMKFSFFIEIILHCFRPPEPTMLAPLRHE